MHPEKDHTIVSLQQNHKNLNIFCFNTGTYLLLDKILQHSTNHMCI